MDPTEIPLTDRARWQNWMNCFKAMVEELRDLESPPVDEILSVYSCKPVDSGLGLNIDWPEGDELDSVPDKPYPPEHLEGAVVTGPKE